MVDHSLPIQKPTARRGFGNVPRAIQQSAVGQDMAHCQLSGIVISGDGVVQRAAHESLGAEKFPEFESFRTARIMLIRRG
jgi:hypothetical protein